MAELTVRLSKKHRQFFRAVAKLARCSENTVYNVVLATQLLRWKREQPQPKGRRRG